MERTINHRRAPRFRCDIPVLACTTILTREARIVNLSTVGAKVQLDQPFALDQRIHLDVEGDYYWGTVVWSEVDRMGVRFQTPMNSGALQRMLEELQAPAVRRPAQFGRRAA